MAAALLWRTTVPHLRLPHVDERRVFGAGVVHDAQRFERFLDWDWVVGTAIALGAYALMARRGRPLAGRLGLGPVNAGIIVGVVVLTVVWTVELPFQIAALWWERRHGISFESYASTVAAAWAQLIGRALIAVVALAIVIGLARRFARWWWAMAAVCLGALLLAQQFVAPYLATVGTHSAPKVLRSELRMLARREHAGSPPLRIQNVSSRTSEENAFSIGVGPSERVIVWDTMLGNPPGETRFVLAHELAHIARNHILRGVAWFVLLTLPVLLLLSRIVDLRRPQSVPIALLVIALARVALLPVQDGVSRRYEAEADWVGLNGDRDPASAQRLFVDFVQSSLQDPSPPGWVHFLLDDHPTALQRVEMARAWRARNP